MVSGKTSWVESKQSQVAQEQSKGLPLPDAAAQEEPLKLIRQSFADEYHAAKTSPREQMALAQELLHKAQKTTDDPACAVRPAQRGGKPRRKAGNAELALQIIDEMDLTFDIDAYKLKVNALLATAKAKPRSPPSQAFFEGILSLADEALELDQFDAAQQLEDAVACQRQEIGDAAWVKQIAARKKEVDAETRGLRKLYAEVQEAEAVLQQNPTDPAANLTVGKYRCFHNGYWAKGVPMLALGSDSTLKNLAAKELQDVQDVNAQVALGDGWWQLAEREGGKAKTHLREHAADYYERALPGLTGLRKQKIAKLEDAAADVSPFAKGYVDILPHVDLEKDRVSGQWVKNGKMVAITKRDAGSRIAAPVEVKGGYDVIVTFTPREVGNSIRHHPSRGFSCVCVGVARRVGRGTLPIIQGRWRLVG